jgi:mono/diheme cytochrome c family protein
VGVSGTVTKHATFPKGGGAAARPPGSGARAGTSVSFCLFVRQTARPLWLVPFALVALALLPGCQDTYNESMVFPVRTDPVLIDKIVIAESAGLAGGVEEPDQPGQLPLSNLKILDDPRNPFFVRLPESYSGKAEENEKELKSRREKLKGAFFDPTTLSEDRRKALQGALQKVFGTPAEPKLDLTLLQRKGGDESEKEKRQEELKGNREQLSVLLFGEGKVRSDQDVRARIKEGGRLYRLHCMQCHGLTGDGRGPTAKWVNPHPRDYRAGTFKFLSVDQKKKGRYPRREDLFRTIKFGLEGTTMPAHNLLPDEELEPLASYVIFLSVRGESELEALKWYAGKGSGKVEEFLFVNKEPGREEVEGEVTKGAILNVLEGWFFSQGKDLVIRPVPYTRPSNPESMRASLEKGHALFKANCGDCHTDYGRRARFKLDEAGWGILVRPADLTTGNYRGGRRPIDLYWRIHSGIPGSGMAAAAMNPEDIWAVVNFVQALPYPNMRPSSVK